MPRRFLTLLALVAVPLVLASCSSDSGSPTSSGSGKATTLEVTLSDTGCEPRSISAQAGPTTFHVTNDGTSAVTEFEVLQGGRILGEVENVFPGGDRTFSITLGVGSYTTKCPGGSSFEGGTLEVAGAPVGAAADTTATQPAGGGDSQLTSSRPSGSAADRP